MNKKYRWVGPTVAAVAPIVIFVVVYFDSVPSERWSDVGAVATAIAAVVAGSGLFFLGMQARYAASAANAAMVQANAAVEALNRSQQQFSAQLDSVRRQQIVWMFEQLTLGQTLSARGRLTEALRIRRTEDGKQLRLSDLTQQDRDDLFEILRRFQLAYAIIFSTEQPEPNVDQQQVFLLIGWDIAWWSGVLTGAFGNSLIKTGLQNSWRALERLRVSAERNDSSLIRERKIAERWVQSLLSSP